MKLQVCFGTKAGIGAGCLVRGECSVGWLYLWEGWNRIDGGGSQERQRKHGAPVTCDSKTAFVQVAWNAEQFPYLQQVSVVFLLWYRSGNIQLLKDSPCLKEFIVSTAKSGKSGKVRPRPGKVKWHSKLHWIYNHGLHRPALCTEPSSLSHVLLFPQSPRENRQQSSAVNN